MPVPVPSFSRDEFLATGLKLFLVQDDDRSCYVLAQTWGGALGKWRSLIKHENPDDDGAIEPNGIQLIGDTDDLIL